MKSIEFVGPSGIGKTTFLKGLLQYRSTNSTWCTGQEILKEINFKKVSLFERMLIKGGKSLGASLKTNRDYLEKIKKHEDHCTPVIEIFLNYLNKSDLENWQKVKSFEYYIKTTLYEKLLILDAAVDKTVVFDEGIIVNGGVIALLDTEEFYNIPKSILFPTAVIFLDLDLANYRERIKSRFLEKGERRINPLIPNITDAELDNYIIEAKEISQKKLQACKILNIPVLEIQPFPSQRNFKEVLRFIDHVDKRNIKNPIKII